MSDDVGSLPGPLPTRASARPRGSEDPFLSWLVFTGLCLLAFILLWFYGLAQKALTSDPTHIITGIALIYVAAALHCLWRSLAISREAAAERSLSRAIAGAEPASTAADNPQNVGLVAAHVRDLVVKSDLTGEAGRFDQTILLHVLAERLTGSNQFGAFASDLSMKLGLFGTIVGFIMMLAPLSGLNPEDQAAIKSSMGLMSDGMAVAMYTTLAGLLGSILIKIQYHFVEAATAKLFTSAVALTEVYVIPAIERRNGELR